MQLTQPALALATIGLVTLVAAFGGIAQEPVQPLSAIVLRHAETAASTHEGGADPGLSEGGQARAEALARLLGHSGTTHLFASEFTRTQSTLAPLAEALGLEVVVVSARDPEAQVKALRALPAGSLAVVCGHSNTAPGIVAGLGGSARDLVEHPTYGGMLDHDSYDRMFVVTLPAEAGRAVTTLELRYGLE